MWITRALVLPAVFLVQNSGFAQTPVVLRSVMPDYPPIAKAARQSINLQAVLQVNSNGSVASVEFTKSAPPLSKYFAKAVFEALNKWEFKPGVSGAFEVDLAFHLYPPATPNAMIYSEFIQPNAVIVRSKFVPVEPTVDHF